MFSVSLWFIFISLAVENLVFSKVLSNIFVQKFHCALRIRRVKVGTNFFAEIHIQGGSSDQY